MGNSSGVQDKGESSYIRTSHPTQFWLWYWHFHGWNPNTTCCLNFLSICPFLTPYRPMSTLSPPKNSLSKSLQWPPAIPKGISQVLPLDLPAAVAQTILLLESLSLFDLCGPEIPIFLSHLFLILRAFHKEFHQSLWPLSFSDPPVGSSLAIPS